ncbi:MAG: fumarylacetoacetate hydrolase family protein [Chloroflexi bacterium]|nr:fumarylacetoacetate hydrolase family protein [Chloroflexota bacterium]MCI0574829.1 fumarylacetoacetate hydrolase family protein [Chloroflexota bacterium]MCI0645953.1 fumarylacetoacetate hydrolase family protein [Chloroflexota bacterium]MCI0727604.1 fumarylacetoacetate hydrolase family protein [Chloroflexota bacterium]
MKLITYEHEGQIGIGAVRDEQVISLSAVALDMLAFIATGPAGLAQAHALVDAATVTIPLASVRLLAPIPAPRRNIMCLGLNYAEHVAESYTTRGRQVQLPETPVIFTKATTAVNGPYAGIPLDPAVTGELDWEAELALVIGQVGKNISREAALSHVFGYMVLNDVTARDLQTRGKQYFKGKSLDGCCPMGPWIVTADELPNLSNLRVTSRVNGLTKQDGNTSQMIFDVPTIIAYLSLGMTLLPGDIISTGTPSGVGFARTPPEFLQPGDIVECEVEGIGTIRNKIVST